MIKKIGIKELKKVKTIEDLENLGIGRVYCDISHRGGGLGFYSEDVASWVDVDNCYLPSKFGSGCNYLGGGLRGSIFPSDFSNKITGKKANLLNALGNACVRVYEYLDSENIEDDVMEGIARVKNVRSAY